MNTSNIISIGQFQIEVVRKNIKNMHLAVYPPKGRIRLAAPVKTDSDVIRLFAASKLGWIKRHVKNFEAQARETPREYITGESHYFFGKRYSLRVIETAGKSKVELKGTKTIRLYVKPDASSENRRAVLTTWFRKQLKLQIPGLLAKWEGIIGVKPSFWGVKAMKTKWGACNAQEKRIWINLELYKKPINCLEYILVHEMVHLLESSHNEVFVAYMNKFLPNWRKHREELNSLPIRHTEWEY